jgi:hypothetical protein
MIQVLTASPRFLDQVQQAALKHFNRPDAAARCVEWSRRLILFHNKRHPAEMGGGSFLEARRGHNGCGSHR